MRVIDKIDIVGRKKLNLGFIQADIYAILANFSTLSNFLLGTLISIRIILGDPLTPIWTMRCLMLGASFDAVDGRLARRSSTQPKLGAQFDTAADLVTFGIAPSLMIYHSFGTVNDILALILSAMYLFGAAFRLSRFMLEHAHGFFSGMPSPVAASYIGAWYLQADASTIPLYAAAIAMISTVMIVSLPYTGMKVVEDLVDKFYVVFTVSMMLLLTYSPDDWMKFLGKIWIVYVTYFTIVGPMHVKNQLRNKTIVPS